MKATLVTTVLALALSPACYATSFSSNRGSPFNLSSLPIPQIQKLRIETHDCQSQLGVVPTRIGSSATELAAKPMLYQDWVMTYWQGKLVACQTALQRATLPSTNDWFTAVRIVQRIFPGSANWLMSCSASEGGYGKWKWRGGSYAVFRERVIQNDHGSMTPGGPMQYMEPTFWGDYNRGVLAARAQGFIIPSDSASWFSMMGQAVAAGWAYGHNRPRGKWTGYGC